MERLTCILFLSLCVLTACSPRPEETEKDKARKAEERLRIEQFLETQEGEFAEIEPGIWMSVEAEGDSIHPQLSSIITVAYSTQSLDGLEIDVSTEDNPLRIRLARLIPAWQQSLPRIGRGGSMKLVTISDEAYGSRSIHPELGAWTPLYFEITLLEVE